MTTKASKRMPRMSASDKALLARVDHTLKLCKFFEFILQGYDHGVVGFRQDGMMNDLGTGNLKPCHVFMEFGTAEWKWLQPLLEELRAFRKTQEGRKERSSTKTTQRNRRP